MRTSVRSVTSQGHPYARFKRSLATRNPTLAAAAAHELEQLALDDVLRLVLLYREADYRRFERGVLRWQARLCAEARGLTLAGAAVSAQALLTIGGSEVERGVEALAELLESAGVKRAVAALDEWVDGLPASM